MKTNKQRKLIIILPHSSNAKGMKLFLLFVSILSISIFSLVSKPFINVITNKTSSPIINKIKGIKNKYENKKYNFHR